MRLTRKSVISLSSVIVILSIWLAGCGPTNGLPALTGEYVYVSNQGDGTISEYAVDTSTGLLTNNAITVDYPNPGPAYPDGAFPGIAGSDPQLMALHPSNEFLFVPDSTDNNLDTIYTADGAQSGRLFSSQRTTPAGTSPFDVTFDPSGDYLYATNANGVSEFSINPTFGQLTSIGSIAVNTPRGLALTYDECNAIVAVVDGTPNPGITVLAENLTGGTLAPPIPMVYASVTTMGTPELDVANPQNPLQIFVTDDADGVVQTITFTQIPEPTSINCFARPFFYTDSVTYVPAEGNPFGITTDPAGKFLYTANPTSNSISIFPISSSGLSTPSVFTGTSITNSASQFDCPISIAIEKMGEYAYVANNCNGTISELAVDSTTGALTSIGVINTENPANPASQPFSVITTR